MHRPVFWLLIVAFAAVVALAIYLTVHRSTSDVSVPVVPVETATVEDVRIYGEYDGTVRPRQTVEIRARVEGYLEKILFEPGTYVRKHQTLFIIDNRLYEAYVEKARAQLKKATVQADKAERDLGRIRPLYEQNAASQLDLDNATAAYESARAELSVARADLTQAELTLGYTVVWSPIDGYIAERSADLGSLVGPASKSLLATVMRTDTVFVDFAMNVSDYLRSKSRSTNEASPADSLSRRLKITANLADGTLYPYHGWIDFSSLQVDPTTGNFTVRAALPNPDHVLLPGAFVSVRVLTDVIANAIELSTEAITTDENGDTYVFVVNPDSIVERRYVGVGQENGRSTIVDHGLASGEKVVIGGAGKVHHGMKVCPVPVNAPSHN